MNQKEEELFRNICKEYIVTKELVSKAEEIDQKSGANLQINKEFRDALSHILRVFGDQLLNSSQKKGEEDNYYWHNLDKARGHIYRAGYDAIDGVAISIRESINSTRDFPASIRTQVVPNFAQKIAHLDAFHKKIVKYKEEKDIGSASSTAFSECMGELEAIKLEAQEYQQAIPTMADLYLEKKKDFRVQIIIAIVFLIIGWFLSGMYSPKDLFLRYNQPITPRQVITNQTTNK